MPVLDSPFAFFEHRTTAKALIKASLRKLGVIGVGENPEANEFTEALEEFNRMVDSWNTERLTVPVVNRSEYTIGSGVDFLEIGPSGNIDWERPLKLEPDDAYIRETGTTTEYPLKVWSRERWGSIPDKGQTGKPSVLYYEPQFPRGVIRLWPKTDKSYDLILYTWGLLAQISNVEQTLALRPAYADAMVHELAARLAPEYGKSVPPEVALGAAQGKANLKRINHPAADARVEDALLPSGGGYDILTDEFR